MQRKIKDIHYILLLSAALTAAVFLGGCSGEEEGEIPEDAVQGYLIRNASNYVKLRDYEGIKAEQFAYIVSDEDVQEEIDGRLAQERLYKAVSRPAQSEDRLTLDMDLTVEGGETQSEKDVQVVLGEWNFGEAFDESLEGHGSNETVAFSVHFGDSDFQEEWAGKTVAFSVTIKKVEEPVYQELTDSYLQELGYGSEREYAKDLRRQMQESRNFESGMNLHTDLVNEAIDRTKFSGYPRELYDRLEKEQASWYENLADTLGISLDQIYDYYDITEDDAANNVKDEVDRRLFLSAYCQENGLYLTEEQLSSFEDSLSKAYGYSSTDQFKEDYGEEPAVWSAYEDMVGTDLARSADITRTQADYSLEDLEVTDDTEMEADVYLDESLLGG